MDGATDRCLPSVAHNRGLSPLYLRSNNLFRFLLTILEADQVVSLALVPESDVTSCQIIISQLGKNRLVTHVISPPGSPPAPLKLFLGGSMGDSDRPKEKKKKERPSSASGSLL